MITQIQMVTVSNEYPPSSEDLIFLDKEAYRSELHRQVEESCIWKSTHSSNRLD